MNFGQIQILARAMMPLLILQFLLGMFANLFVTFTTSSAANRLASIFTEGSPALMAHVIIGIVLFVLSLIVLIFAGFTSRRRLLGIASLGFASMAVAFFSGIAFVFSTYADNSLSYLMAVGFIIAFIVYGGLAGGARRPAGQFSAAPESGVSHAAQTSSRPVGLTVLQLLVGVIAVFGGSVLILSSGRIDSTFGAVHVALGLLAFPSAYGIWKGKTWSVAFAKVTNVAIVLFSTASEIVVVATASTAQVLIGSLVGTLLAIGISLALILNLPGIGPGRMPQATKAQPTAEGI